MPRTDDRRRSADGAVILGVDPGLLRTGYALLGAGSQPDQPALVEAGLIRLPRHASLGVRLAELGNGLETLIKIYRPVALACEELYTHYRHPRTAILMAHARGVILVVGARAGLEIIPVAATNAKKLLTGSGRASKRQVQSAVAVTLQLPGLPEPSDVADAIAIAMCGLRLWQARGIIVGASWRAGQ